MLESLHYIATDWLTAMQDLQFWWQLIYLLLVTAIASLINHRLQQGLQARGSANSGFRHIAVRSAQRLLWPLSSLALLLPGKAIFEYA